MNVSEFSKQVGITPHTTRYYDKIGLIGNVRRMPNGHRVFSQKDIQWIEFVQRLKETDMPLKSILAYAKLREKGACTLEARKAMLVNHARMLSDIINKQQGHLETLSNKIGLYDEMLTSHSPLD
jgi:DNA-binding transcriptional MerR regulator